MPEGAGASRGPRRRRGLLARGRRGVTTAIFAMSLTALLGVIGLGTEGALWYADWVQLQGAADSTALSGAVSISVAAEQTSTSYGPAAAMTYAAAQNGDVSGTGGVTVTPHYPPVDGSYSGNQYAAEVVISKTEPLRFASLFMSVGPTISARAVALYKSNSPACVMSLGSDTSSSNDGDISMSGAANLNAAGCTVVSDSSSAHAFEVDPSAKVTAYTMQAVGSVASTCGQGPTGCGNDLTLTRPYSSNSVASTDPLKSVQNVALPSTSGTSSPFNNTSCTSIPFPNWNSEPTEGPGNYCNISISGASQLTVALSGGVTNACTSGCSGAYVIGTGGTAISIGGSSSGTISGTSNTFFINGSISLSGAATLNIAPGTYFINNGSLIVGAGTSLTCTACVAGGAGATFVLMGSSPGTVSVSGSSPVTFSAPSISDYDPGFDGVAIYEPPTNTGTNTLSGSGTLNIQGAFYAPGALLNISGAAGTASTTCTWFIANTIKMTGSGYASNADCASYGYAWGSSKGTIALVQ